ncbi:MAG: class I SAM-dependent methyltransferase [bacterium]|nr:class I SAM-dependent methyltransferase [bacterium]
MNVNNSIEFSTLVDNLSTALNKWEESVKNLSSNRDLDAIMPQLIDKIYSIHNLMETLAQHADAKELACYTKLYRDQLNHFWLQGGITRRVIEKPQGYHGDYMTMKMMYDNRYEGATMLGKCLHKFVTNDPSGSSVRKRKEHLEKRLLEVGSKKESAILSVACGPAAELCSAIKQGARFSRIVLLDQDLHALDFALSSIRKAIAETGSNIELISINHSIYDLVKGKDNTLEKNGPFDYVYSAGLYDYLPKKYAVQLTKSLLNLLTDKGCLEIGNFTRFPIAFFAHIAGGWEIIAREAEELLALFPEDCAVQYQTVGDQTFAFFK